ncbi:Endonuclease [Rhodovulum sp. P5]|uniref:YraN family protein n=1 Tax=Rhodovulum sp. P5 TaxID=1564506 RepID=UPI0009C1D518|nr:YraN family protein [Rhodovulum sp. P5]ARE39772.1 Endonuclease [Rhodovulum sp. P5]
MSGTVSYHAGLSAEESVARHYQARGLTVAARRWRGKAGEIDLILRDGEGLIFVEVKKSRDFARAAERLTHRQMTRVMTAALEFVGGEPRGQLTDMRFDVALVNGQGAVEILENAFTA